jgi:hypothetical protein
MKRGHWIALAVAFGVIGLAVAQMMRGDKTGGFNAPAEQPHADDDLSRLMDHSPDGHPSVLCQPSQHHAGYVYTRHRYPRAVGGEITALIHKGYSSMRIPNSQDVQWMIAPPSEVMF